MSPRQHTGELPATDRTARSPGKPCFASLSLFALPDMLTRTQSRIAYHIQRIMSFLSRLSTRTIFCLQLAVFVLLAGLAATDARAFISIHVNVENGTYHIIRDAYTKNGAYEESLQLCTDGAAKDKIKADCKHLGVEGTKGYLVVARSADRIGVGFDAKKSKAEATALKNCSPHSKSECKVVVVSQEKVGTPAGKKTVRSTTATNNTMSCTNQCRNGNCVRTFPDGRTERWQAPRVYDPFSQNWKWDTTTNACGI